MSAIRWQGGVDFLVLAVAIYVLLQSSREARALRLALSILALRVGGMLARQFDLLITGWVLDACAIVALLTLLFVFQPELRRALMRFDLARRVTRDGPPPAITAVSQAVWSLAQARCGALIVIARNDSLAELVTSGVVLGAQVSAEILEAVFQKGSPVHDGAAIIESDVVIRVGAILPLTQRPHVPEQYGTRHRAALGLAERSDALVIVASEERGETTLMWESQVRPIGSLDELRTALETLTTARAAARTSAFLRGFRGPELALKGTALALSALVWSVTFLVPGRSVRMHTASVELTNVPAGMSVASQSTNTLDVWLRGSDFLLDSVNLGALVARCDLAAAHEGLNVIRIQPDALDVPVGLRVESLAPHEISVSLTTSPESHAAR
ncbi:MAG: diadenylate cyclase CdaA [Gemmatimonadaceae bacterium]